MSSEERPNRVAGPGRVVVVYPTSTPEGLGFRILDHGTPDWRGRAGHVPTPARAPHPAAGPGFPETMARALAQRFSIDLELVKDILAAISSGSRLPYQELEGRATIALTGMCNDLSSDSEVEDGPEDDGARASGDVPVEPHADANRGHGRNRHGHPQGHHHRHHRHAKRRPHWQHGKRWR